MFVPKQVEEASKAAEELHGEMFPKGVDTAEEPVAPEAPAATETSEEEADTSDKDKEGKETPAEKPAEEINWEEKYAALQEENAALKGDHDTLTQQHSTLKGKYDAEVPRLHNSLKQMKEDIVKQVKESVATAPESTPATPEADEHEQKMREEYGDAYVDNMLKLVETRFPAKQTPAAAETSETETPKTVEELEEEIASKEFMTFLDNNVEGDWKNAFSGENPKFNAFLETTGPDGLETYGELVDKYNKQWDQERLAKVFNLFFKSQEPAPEKEETTETPEKETPEVKPTAEEEALVAPNRSPQHATPKASEPILWTTKSMNAFIAKDRKGGYSEEDSVALWNDLAMAPGEGRFTK